MYGLVCMSVDGRTGGRWATGVTAYPTTLYRRVVEGMSINLGSLASLAANGWKTE